MLSVYLAGPIENCTLEEACAWRREADAILGDHFRILDPMKGKYRIVPSGQVILKKDYNPALRHLCSSDSVYHRDLFCVRKANIVLVNLTFVNRGGKGTFFEMGFASALGKLLVAVSPDEHVLGHPFIEMSAIKFEDMGAAFDFLLTMAS